MKFRFADARVSVQASSPTRGMWIEMDDGQRGNAGVVVIPHTGDVD